MSTASNEQERADTEALRWVLDTLARDTRDSAYFHDSAGNVGVSPAAAKRALARMIEAGIVEVDTDRSLRLREGYAPAAQVVALFLRAPAAVPRAAGEVPRVVATAEALLARSTPVLRCPTCDAINVSKDDTRADRDGTLRHFPCPAVSVWRGQPTAAEYPLRDVQNYPTPEEYAEALRALVSAVKGSP